MAEEAQRSAAPRRSAGLIMPRRIDAELRTEQIGAAALRVLERDGLGGLSVRGVATEAGIAAASLRRVFPSQHALRVYCLERIEARATERIAALDLEGRELAEGLLAQLLPLDDVRRVELIAQVQLGVLALTDDTLRPAAVRLSAGVDRACTSVIEILAHAGELGDGRDPVAEARRLRALLDGLAMHDLWGGNAETSTQALQILAHHFDELARPVN